MEEDTKSIDDLPKGWVKCKLIDCGDIASGGTPSTKILEYWGNEVSWITPADLSGYENKHISKGQKSITSQGLLKSSAKLMPKGSVLFSTRAPIGYVVIASNDICTNQGFKSIIPNSLIYNEFLYHFFKSAKQLAEKHASGTTFKELSLKAFSQIPINVAPFREQHRIVAKIEELFSELDKGVEALKTAQQQLKVYRQAVLKWAFEGKLTEEWRKQQKNLPTASKIMEQIKTEREEQATATGKKLKPIVPLTEAGIAVLPGLPEGWCWAKLGEVCEKIFDGTHFSPPNYQNGKYKYITAKNIKEWGIDLTELSHVSEEEHKKIFSRCDVKKGDVLYIKDGATTGIATVNNMDEEFSLLSSVGVFRVSPNRITPKYLSYYLNSQITRNRMLANIAGVAITRLTLVKLNHSIFILSSITEQNLIIQEIETRLSVADKLEETITQSLQQAKALRQSILKKAFAGKLVPQDPNDEPASKLLERIKAERASQAPVKRAQ